MRQTDKEFLKARAKAQKLEFSEFAKFIKNLEGFDVYREKQKVCKWEAFDRLDNSHLIMDGETEFEAVEVRQDKRLKVVSLTLKQKDGLMLIGERSNTIIHTATINSLTELNLIRKRTVLESEYLELTDKGVIQYEYHANYVAPEKLPKHELDKMNIGDEIHIGAYGSVIARRIYDHARHWTNKEGSGWRFVGKKRDEKE